MALIIRHKLNNVKGRLIGIQVVCQKCDKLFCKYFINVYLILLLVEKN